MISQFNVISLSIMFTNKLVAHCQDDHHLKSVWNTYNSIGNCNINSYGDKDIEISWLDNIPYWEEEEEAPAQMRDIIWTEQR